MYVNNLKDKKSCHRKVASCINIRRVSKDIGRLLALALDLDANYFDTPEMLGKPIATMRLLHYQGHLFHYYEQYRGLGFLKSLTFLLPLLSLGVSDPSQGIYACGAHSDYGMMTLLATDGVMGLQVLKASQFFFFPVLIPFDKTVFL